MTRAAFDDNGLVDILSDPARFAAMVKTDLAVGVPA
jgi:hypothetical protein